MIQAEVEGLGTLEFPDDTDPAVVQQTVKRVVSEQRAHPSALTPENLKRDLGPFNPLELLTKPGVGTTALRVAPALAGGMLGGPIGGGIGAAAGEMAAQAVEGQGIRWPTVGLEAGLGMIPGGKTGTTVLRNLGKRALQGSAFGAGGGAARIGLEEGRLPTKQEALTQGIVGGVLGLGLGGLEARLRRPRVVSGPLLALPPARPLPVTPEGQVVVPRTVGGVVNYMPEGQSLPFGLLPQDITTAQKRLNAPVKVPLAKASRVTVTTGHFPEVQTDVPLPSTPVQSPAPTTPRMAPVEYAGYQEGFGKVPGFHLYTLTDTISDRLVKGSTVDAGALRQAGYDVPPPPAPWRAPKPIAAKLPKQPPTSPPPAQPEMSPEVSNRMAMLRSEVDDARTNLPTGKIFGTTEGETGMIQKHAIGAGKSIREQLAPLYPELSDLPNVGPKEIVTAIEKDRGNTLYLQIKDAVTRQLEREKVIPGATAQRPSDFDEFSRFVDDLAAQPEPKAPPVGQQPKLFQTQAELPPTPLQPKAPQVPHEELLSGMKPQEPTRQGGLPLSGEPTGTVEFGMGLPIPKAMKDRLRRFFGPEGQEQGLPAKGWHTATTIFNRVLGKDAEGVPMGERHLQILKEIDKGQGRGDLILKPLDLQKLSDAENLAVKQTVNEGRTVPLTERARRAVEAWKAYRQEAAQTAKQLKVEVRRDAIFTAPGGEKLRGTTWKPFQDVKDYYPNAPDWRKIAAIDPAQFRRLMIRDHQELPAQTINELVDGYIAQAKGQPMPRHVGDEASRIIRGGQPSASFLHERHFKLPSEVLADLSEVFPRYIEDTSREFAIARVAGPRGQLFEDAITAAQKTGNRDAQLAMQEWDALTRRNIVDRASQDVGRGSRILGNLATAMFIGPTTAVKQLSQTAMAAAELPIRSFIKGFSKALTKEGWRDAKQFGATIDAVWQDMQMQKRFGEALHPAATLGEKIEHGTQRVASAVVRSSGTTFMDSFGRVLGYNGALDDLTRAQQLAKTGNAKATAYLAKHRLTATSGVEAVKTAASRVSDQINLRADPSSVPVFLYKPGLQTAMRQLNSFNYAMGNKLLRNYITPLGRAVAAGDIKATGSELIKMTKFAVAMGVGGEFIGDTIREIQGRRTDRPGGAPEEFASDLVKGIVPWKVVRNRLLTNLADAGTFGTLQLVKEALLSGGGKGETTSRLIGTLAGAGISNAAELAYHAGNLAYNAGDTEPGPRGGKSPWEQATSEATRAAGRRIPVAGSLVAGRMPASQTSDRRIHTAGAVRARIRKDTKLEADWKRRYRQRQGENISPTAIRKATQEYNQ